ncbi:sialate O-acetylesterase [Paenibacillus agricola]|uniref:F5/8 type C domain-containing protein n=1 Tax=Paenibacillus agricola TaxID=2716264 RepID=A0ABX0J2C9_9BACL|nr:sialate O-acetylesterase [Paenibacillus agricola]NHN29037.1 hypothetical protein [Paenibacillus agricola]
MDDKERFIISNLESSNIHGAGTNLALGKAVTIKQGGTQKSYPAEHITDGKADTMWRPATDAQIDLVLDLGRQELLNKIVIVGYQQQTIHLSVQISDEPLNWTEVYSHSLDPSDDGHRTTEINVDNLSSRYIRIFAEPVGVDFGIYELQVFNLVAAKVHMIEHLGLYGGEAQAIQASQPNFHLYLFIGQSNMASRASIDNEDLHPIDRAYVWNGLNQWEKAENGLVTNLPQITAIQGLNRYASVEVSTKLNGFHLASTFAQVLVEQEQDTQIEIGIIANARGGTALAEWQKGAGTGLYEEAIRRTQEAMKWGTLKGVLWHQGESDQNDADTYFAHLNRLVADLRNDLQAPGVPFIVGQLLPTKNAAFNQAMTTIAEHIPNTNWVSNEGTNSTGDGTHLDNASQKLFGRRYAERIIEHYK